MTAITESAITENPSQAQRLDAGIPGKRPTHVLFLVDRFPNTLGGAERVLLRTTRLLLERGYRCSVVTFEGDPRFRDIRPPFDCPFYVFPLRRTYDANAIRVGLKLRRFIRSEQVDIAHTFFSTSDLWGGFIAKSARCPVLISSRRDMGIERSFKHQVAYRLIGGLFDQVQAVSEQVRIQTIAQDRISAAKVVTLHNGVDLDEIRKTVPSRVRKILGVESAAPLIVSVGNIRPVKGFDVMLEAAAKVCRRFPRAIFAIVGGIYDQEYYQWLKQQITTLKLQDNVRFLGYTENAVPLLKGCDIYCQCSRSEGLPNSVLEAMACGLPCVATAVGGTPEVIAHQRNGLLVSSDDPNSCAEQILDLLEDPASRRRLGQAAERTIAENFTSRIMVDRLIKYYEEILASKRIDS